MSHRDSKVEGSYIDADFSSGDSNRPKTKQLYQEENNNEVNELSKELSEMGCIVDAMKRPPNICVETCVYDSETEEEKSKSIEEEEDGYSDEFEEDKSEEEEESIKTQPKSASDISKSQTVPSSMKLSKSQSSMSHRPPGSVTGRSTTDYGSISVPPTRRINMSFTNERLREIERHNHILLTKILSARNSRKSSIPPREQAARKPVPSAAVSRKNQQRQIDRDNMLMKSSILVVIKSSIPPREQAARKPVPSAAVSRKNQQRQIDRDNMILLKKIQRAKSSVPSVRR